MKSGEQNRGGNERPPERAGFQLLSENVPFGLVMIGQDGTFEYVNPKFKELFGYDLADVPSGRAWFRKAYLDPDYRHHVISVWMDDSKHFKPGEQKPRVFNATCKDGTTKIINFITVQLENGQILIACEDITERRRTEEALRYRIEFEKLIMTLSTHFINLASNEVDGAIYQALQTIGEFAGVDRSYVFLFSDDGKKMDNTHEWCAPGIEPQIQRLKGIRVDEELPYFGKIIKSHQVFYVPRVADLPDEARAEKEDFRFQGIQSLICVPMIYGSSLIGFLGFDSVRNEKAWSEDTIGLLKIAGEVLVSALERQRVEQTLQKSQEKATRLARENAIMAEIGRIISSTLNIEDVYELFAQKVQKIIPFDQIVINTIHPSKDRTAIAYAAGVDVPGGRVGDSVSLKGTGTESCMHTRSTLLIQRRDANDLAARFPELLPALEAGLRSFMFVPLISNDQFIGAISLRSAKSNAYTDRDLRLAEGVGNQIAGAIANAQLFRERTRAEEALRESVAKYRQLVEHAPAGIYEVDLTTSKLLSVNDIMCDLTGYTRDELLSLSPFSLLMEESRNRLSERIEKISSGEKTRETVEYKIRTKDGREFWALLNTKVFCKDGRPLKAQVVAQDISERKKLEEQLLQSQKMEAVGRLAGGIAHDFNNLLTIISGYSQLSLSALEEGEPFRESFEQIQKATERAAALTRQLLAFSRRQIMEMRVLDLNTVLRDLEKLLRRVIGEDIELITILSEDLGRIKADHGQVEQVILNMAVNARDAMPAGGKFILETSNVELDEEYARSHIAVTPGPYIRLSVSDTGAGMSMEVRERIFEPFFTTKEQGKGTGLGLSMVYGIVKQSGGNIWAYSEVGRGTTFKIYLPRLDEAIDSPKLDSGPHEILRGSETVLLVEDEEAVRTLARKTLESWGYSILEASNGHEALRVVQEHPERTIHLLLTDVIMPGMSGRDLAEHLIRLLPELKVLYMSGYTDNAIFHHGVLDPGIHFLQKPFSPQFLLQKVQEALRNGSKGIGSPE